MRTLHTSATTAIGRSDAVLDELTEQVLRLLRRLDDALGI